MQSKASCVLRKIDIGTWRSSVAGQFGIHRLPTVWLYDGTNRVTTDLGTVFTRVRELD